MQHAQVADERGIWRIAPTKSEYSKRETDGCASTRDDMCRNICARRATTAYKQSVCAVQMQDDHFEWRRCMQGQANLGAFGTVRM